ncbi:MAG: diacylglycerol kinase family protein [Polyangiales bacterium]
MTPAEPFVAIINPRAGGGRCGQRAAGVLDDLAGRGLRFERHFTREPGDATRIAREQAERGRRRFIAVGGDGTSYEIVNGVAPFLASADPSQRVSLGFLPLGTGNSFLRDFGRGDTETAIEALISGRSRACDVMRLEHDTGALHYLNLLSLGFVTEICALANRHFKRLGASGYGLGVIAALANLASHSVRMRVDGDTPWEQSMVFVSVCNSRFTGGSMMMAPYADTNDGLADVVVCGEMSRLTLIATFPKIFRGLHVHHHAIRASRVRSLEFLDPSLVDLMVDGELVRHVPKRIDVRPAALDVFV